MWTGSDVKKAVQTHVQKSREDDVLVSLLHEEKEKTVGCRGGWGWGGGYDAKNMDTDLSLIHI